MRREERMSIPEPRFHLSRIHAAVDRGPDLHGVEGSRRVVRLDDRPLQVDGVPLGSILLDKRARHEDDIRGGPVGAEVQGEALLEILLALRGVCVADPRLATKQVEHGQERILLRRGPWPDDLQGHGCRTVEVRIPRLTVRARGQLLHRDLHLLREPVVHRGCRDEDRDDQHEKGRDQRPSGPWGRLPHSHTLRPTPACTWLCHVPRLHLSRSGAGASPWGK